MGATQKQKMETIEIEGKQYAITGYADDGLPIIKAEAISTQDGFDEDGNPKISVIINVPSTLIGATPGEVN
jgi:hypothetical protein